ncbi:MAG: hypothetical protein LBJ12_01180 [Oscillospiraceae bacterium]|nr:hypothetical protein [Oscillospiraceae bacterium]
MVAAMLTGENPTWSGRPTELVKKLGLEIQPNTLTQRLNVNAGRLQTEYNIRYENTRTHSGRVIKLVLSEETA